MIAIAVEIIENCVFIPGSPSIVHTYVVYIERVHAHCENEHPSYFKISISIISFTQYSICQYNIS